jgi:hypothetical protein
MIAWDLQPQRRRPGGHLGDGGAHGACNGSAAAGVKSGLSRSLLMLAAAARQFVLPAGRHGTRHARGRCGAHQPVSWLSRDQAVRDHLLEDATRGHGHPVIVSPIYSAKLPATIAAVEVLKKAMPGSNSVRAPGRGWRHPPGVARSPSGVPSDRVSRNHLR